jgi:hypothetical protein
VLDHLLVSPAMPVTFYQVVHINAEFTNQTSDHNPQVSVVAALFFAAIALRRMRDMPI